MSNKQNLSPREELLAIQKRVFCHNKQIIEDSILVQEKDFSQYEKNYLNCVRTYERVVSLEELKRKMVKAQFVFVGDYHTNPQSQRSFLRLLRALVGETKNFCIALEFIQRKKQIYVDQYLASKLPIEKFLKKIELKKHFHFDLWGNFKPLFDFAIYHGVKIYGLETAPYGSGLVKRDQAMAATLKDIHGKNPNSIVVCLVGDLHIAPKNLPRQLRASLNGGKPGKMLHIYQNSEKIYWQLAQAGLEDKVEIVQLGEWSYCLMNTPPVVWQQSYLNWLENEIEFDYSDPKANFVDLMERIAAFLEIKVPDTKDEVEIFTWDDLSFLDRLENASDFTVREIKAIKQQIESSESYYIPKRKWVYLGNLSINHAAEEASHCLKHLLSGEEFPRSGFDAFYANVLHEAVGFFGSKLINHKRKCLRERDYASLIEYFKTSQDFPRVRHLEVEIARFVLSHQATMKKGKDPAMPEHLFSNYKLFFGVSHALGYLLGERIYYAMLKELIRKREVIRLYRSPFKEEGEPFLLYHYLYNKTARLRLPHRL